MADAVPSQEVGGIRPWLGAPARWEVDHEPGWLVAEVISRAGE
ncbi:hypothetical protein [Terrabacter sp. Soil811]|nr:hypothetical protein [Terrabacter sp. Soil811]